MASAVSLGEIQAPECSRVFCMAVTADGDHWRGRPSSWSAKADDLAYGEGTIQRMVAISAGNIPQHYPAVDYLNQNDLAGIESPAQAWNALTVGAVTERCNITDPTFAGWRVMAPAGDLSPCSRTSMTFNDDWPIKPEVVSEGGNPGVDPATGAGDHVDDLALLGTFHRPNERLLTVTGNTRAAAALVARMGAQLTVGAVTERCSITDPTFAGCRVMAPAGDLSPCSRTSMTFNDDWPIKPEVVSEGGNPGVDPATGAGDHVDDLALLGTFHRPNERLLTVTGNTSAAAALVARMGAQLLAANSDSWPETVRGLIVHSARWTNAMRAHLRQDPNQSHKKLLVRRYGYGVPDLERMLRSASNDVTLVVEGEMQPFRLDGTQAKSRDMTLHDFPWPRAELEALGGSMVVMRVSLEIS